MAKLTAEEKTQRQQQTAALLATINKASGVPVNDTSMAKGYFEKAGVKVTTNPATNEVKIDGKLAADYTKPSGKTAIDMQKKKEEQFAKLDVDSAKIKRDRTKKEYEDYTKSNEYRKRLAETDQRNKQQEVANLFLPPEMRQAPKVIQDDKEIRLRAAMEEAEREFKAEEDRKLMEADMEAVTGLSNEDRQQLEQYAVNQIRDQNMPVEFQSMPFFKTAEQEASGLIGKIGKQRADELAETYMRQENEKFAEDVAAKGREHAGTGFWSGVGSSLATVPINLAAGVVGSTGQLQAAARNTGRYKTLDPNATGTALQNYTGAVRGQVGQNISGDVYDEEGNLVKEGGALRGLGSLAYQGLMSGADSAARAAVGGGTGGAILAAANSFSQTMADASAKGATPKQAALLAGATAGIEALSEKIPLDRLVDTAKAGKQPFKQIIKTALQQAGIEATTEEISMIGTILAEAAILKEKSSFNRDFMGKILNGVPPEQAKAEVMKGILKEAWDTALVSMIAGFGSSVEGSAAANYQATEADTTPNMGTPDDIKQKALEQVRNIVAQKTAPAEQVAPAAQTEPVVQTEATKATVAENATADKAEANVDTEIDHDDDIDVDEEPEEVKAIADVLRSSGKKKSFNYEGYKVSKYTGGSYKGEPYFSYRITAPNGDVIKGETAYYNDSFFSSVAQEIDNHRKVNSQHTQDQQTGTEANTDIADKLWGKRDGENGWSETAEGNSVWATALAMKEVNPEYFDAYMKAAEGEHTTPLIDAVINAANDVRQESISPMAAATVINEIYTQKGEAGLRQLYNPKNGNLYDSVLERMKAVDAENQTGTVKTEAAKSKNAEMKGTGAAEQNFSGKAEYQNLLSDDNVQRNRPGDVRPMEVPKTDSFGRRVSELVGNAAGAEITTDKMANTIEELVQEGALGFDVRHNQDSMNTAAKQIEQRGVAATRKQITNAVASGKIRDGDVEQAILLYAMYNSKDTPTAIDNASEILVDLATMANITGRNLQMFRLLRKMTPEGQVTTIRKTVQGNIDSMIKSGAVKKGYTTEIDPELLAEYRKAAGENMRAVSEEQKKVSADKMKTIMDAIYAMEAAKMPATMKAKWDAWRYMAMLGNVKTQVRNVMGNVAFVPYKEVKDRTAALAEKLFVKKEKRTKSVFTDLELLEWARQDRGAEDIKNALKYTGKIGEDSTNQKIRDGMQVFKNKGLDKVRKLVEEVPARGDMLFKNGYYARSLADFMRARGYTAADIQNGNVSAEVLNEARSYAVQEAMKATFNDANVLSDFFATGIHYKGDNPVGKVWNMAMEGVLPFRRTPANIAVRFEEYSPLGIVNTLWKAVDPMKTGKYTAADVVDSLASSLTGSAAMALGFVLAKGLMGIKLTGSNLSEDEERQGHQEYAIEYADKDGNEYSYKIDWAAPANLPLFIGANIHDAIESRGENADVSKFTAFLRGLGNAFEPMLALSCLSGINDLFESARYANEDEALYTVAANIATGYITQGIPALTRQAAQAAQEVKRATFSDSTDPTVRDIESTLAGVPFYGENFKTDKVNAWGEKESTGTAGERIFNAFINPGTLKKIDNSALEQEISRLNKSQAENVAPSYIPKVISYTDKDGNKHNNHRMTEEEYQTLAQTQGQTARSILESMIKSTNYAAMTDDQRAKAMQQVYTYAREKAMQKAFPDHLGYSESWMQELREGKEADYILRRVTNSEINRTMSNLTTAWDNKYSTGVTDSYSRELETAYDSYSKMDATQKRQVKEFATGNAAKYIEAREKGISHGDFITTARNVNNVKGTGKNGTVRDIDRRQAIAKTTGLTPEEVDKMMKVYMPDYDKTDDSPETTEFKYQYIREELDLSPAEYASTYKAYLDGEKKAGKIAAIMRLGYDWKTANAIYKVHSGSMKQKLIAMYG